ncbi:MAG: dienelactone hydrolase family protein [Candidatus Lindowbacteria bacterium]|nr:dienelactone hydrolase family protein [Candidatus Lindowbacteria bacterium]
MKTELRYKFDVPIEYITIGELPALSLKKGNPTKGIIHFHGNEASKETDLLLLLSLVDAGFWVICPDAIGHGERVMLERKPFLVVLDMVFQRVVSETETVKEYFNEQGIDQISMIGRSMGGMRAIIASTAFSFEKLVLLVTGGNIQELFTNSKSSTLSNPDTLKMIKGEMKDRAAEIEPLVQADRINEMPVLLTGGGLDQVVPLPCVHALRDKLSKRKDFEYIEYGDSGHGLTSQMVRDVVEWITK